MLDKWNLRLSETEILASLEIYKFLVLKVILQKKRRLVPLPQVGWMPVSCR